MESSANAICSACKLDIGLLVITVAGDFDAVIFFDRGMLVYAIALVSKYGAQPTVVIERLT